MSKTPLTNAHHVIPIWVYVLNLIALASLMALTVGMSYVQLPAIGPLSGVAVNNIVAMTIATIKAILVIMFFMHVRWSSWLTRMWIIGGFVTASLMGIILMDYATRAPEIVPGFDNKDDSAFNRVMQPNQPNPTDPNEINFHPR